jgi:hypothetical protein
MTKPTNGEQNHARDFNALVGRVRWTLTLDAGGEPSRSVRRAVDFWGRATTSSRASSGCGGDPTCPVSASRLATISASVSQSASILSSMRRPSALYASLASFEHSAA